MRIKGNTKEQIKKHALSVPGEEVCGVLLKNGETLPIKNVSETPESRFELDFDQFEAIKNNPLYSINAIYHTHIKESQSGYLSEGDCENSRYFKIPYLLYHATFDCWDYFDSDGLHPYPLELKSDKLNNDQIDWYIGWKFEYSRSDCAALLRSFYKGFLGIRIKDFARVAPDNLTENTWHDVLTEAGFEKLDRDAKLMDYDIPLMRIESAHPNNVGILHNTWEKKMLVHFGGKHLSKQIIYKDWYVNATAAVYRYKGFA